MGEGKTKRGWRERGEAERERERERERESACIEETHTHTHTHTHSLYNYTLVSVRRSGVTKACQTTQRLMRAKRAPRYRQVSSVGGHANETRPSSAASPVATAGGAESGVPVCSWSVSGTQ